MGRALRKERGDDRRSLADVGLYFGVTLMALQLGQYLHQELYSDTWDVISLTTEISQLEAVALHLRQPR
jgi:hypothetical protein